MYVYNPFSPHNDITIANVLFYFSRLLIITLIFHGIDIIELHKLPCFVFCL
jgi:hypothetical protein